jgi:hypothetical protein
MTQHFASRMLIALAASGLMIPPSYAAGDEPAVMPGRVNSALQIEDVSLGQGESFHGVLLSERGEPIADADVELTQLGRQVAVSKTDEAGQFGFQGLRGGLHLVKAGQSAQLLRLWKPGTAPPHAKNGVIISEQLTVRGQRPFKDLITSNAFIITGVIVAAIAIPIAVHDARNDKSGS